MQIKMETNYWLIFEMAYFLVVVLMDLKSSIPSIFTKASAKKKIAYEPKRNNCGCVHVQFQQYVHLKHKSGIKLSLNFFKKKSHSQLFFQGDSKTPTVPTMENMQLLNCASNFLKTKKQKQH